MGPSRPQTGWVRLSKSTHTRNSREDKSLDCVCLDSKPLSRTSQYDQINLSTRVSYGLADLYALSAVYQWAQSAHVSSSAQAPSLTRRTTQAIILLDHKRPPCKKAESHRGHRSVQWFTRSLPDTFLKSNLLWKMSNIDQNRHIILAPYVPMTQLWQLITYS